ncbi:MAG: OadG family protein [Bacteroidales bacterium]|jgi:Na+-transporting methylmalonyl-CoA/oxaloacetate decarboxylase gamma subunit|nr:OadG family protein [Bacteroidales bacterium]
MSTLLNAIGSEGITISIVGIFIVFAALFTLSFIFNTIPKIINYKARKEQRKKDKAVVVEDDLTIDGDTNAAIAMALHMYFSDQHDDESGIITIERSAKKYSPWSSKIYSMNSYFNKK